MHLNVSVNILHGHSLRGVNALGGHSLYNVELQHFKWIYFMLNLGEHTVHYVDYKVGFENRRHPVDEEPSLLPVSQKHLTLLIFSASSSAALAMETLSGQILLL